MNADKSAAADKSAERSFADRLFDYVPPAIGWPLVVIGSIPILILGLLAVCLLPPKWTGLRTVKEVLDDL